jgi:hypothetical protein
MSSSFVQHLNLGSVSIEDEIQIPMPGAFEHHGWPLRSLHLELHWRLFDPGKGRTSLPGASVLRHCAPTLESLTWPTELSPSDGHDIQSFDLKGLELPRFSHLRDLELGQMNINFSTLDLLLPSESQIRL